MSKAFEKATSENMGLTDEELERLMGFPRQNLDDKYPDADDPEPPKGYFELKNG